MATCLYVLSFCCLGTKETEQKRTGENTTRAICVRKRGTKDPRRKGIIVRRGYLERGQWFSIRSTVTCIYVTDSEWRSRTRPRYT